MIFVYFIAFYALALLGTAAITMGTLLIIDESWEHRWRVIALWSTFAVVALPAISMGYVLVSEVPWYLDMAFALLQLLAGLFAGWALYSVCRGKR